MGVYSSSIRPHCEAFTIKTGIGLCKDSKMLFGLIKAQKRTRKSLRMRKWKLRTYRFSTRKNQNARILVRIHVHLQVPSTVFPFPCVALQVYCVGTRFQY